MQVTGEQFKRIHEALMSAFPSASALDKMLQMRLGVQLSTIAARSNLGDDVFSLVMWAQSNGWLEELLQAAAAANPGSAPLAALVAEFAPQTATDPDIVRSVASDVIANMDSMHLSPAKRDRLVKAFLRLPLVQDTSGRDKIVSMLPDIVRTSIPRSRLVLDDIFSIVTTCADLGRLSDLLAAIEFFMSHTTNYAIFRRELNEIFSGQAA